MILLIGGTSDAREIARKLTTKGLPVVMSTATGYGSQLAVRDGVSVMQGRMDCQTMVQYIKSKSIQVLLDASHPFAEEVTKNAVKACQLAQIPYIRYARPEERIQNPFVEKVNSYQEAAERACHLGQKIFLTVGSKMSPLFIDTARKKGRDIIIRVIPDPVVIKELIELGVSPSNVVAMQGPFSEELNVAILRHYKADVMVTKESGREGGLHEKISAARRLEMPVVMIKRPPEPKGAVSTFDEAVTAAFNTIKRNHHKN